MRLIGLLFLFLVFVSLDYLWPSYSDIERVRGGGLGRNTSTAGIFGTS